MTSVPPPPLSAESDRRWAIAAHASGVLSVIGPLVVWLLQRDRGTASVREAKEALNVQLTVLIVCAGLAAAGVILDVLLIGWIARSLMGLVQLAGVVIAIVGAVTCARTGAVRYPFALRLIR
ncbi:DUF4870 domain-containing protein [Mycetocola reblochoni]|uniref:DUF4870 domain-containing protein n=2 Tax=Mycetocola reblochoni TaxID=331618 RepID=A0A1R4K3Z1_9MICO|nr:DUF4870 domain-containing protein [Mycetocola reblochoni]RLP69897.1 DUF4870 domain-containing protein [Mycetocola reblochoni]SJN38948.1 hypothetical protein FM119_11195 [Mycetocola reblochoni REB411]